MNITNYLGLNINMGLITEAVRNRDIDKAIKLMKSYLLKHGVYTYKFTLPLSKDGKASFGVLAWNEQNKGVCFVWTRDDSARIDSLLFTSNFDECVAAWTAPKAEKYKWDVCVDCKGANLVKICYLVDKVMNGKISMDARAINKDLADAQLFESEEEPTLHPMGLLMEDIVDDAEKNKMRIYMKIRNWKQKGKDVSELEKEYEAAQKALEDARLAVRNGVTTTLEKDQDIEALNDYFEEEERATPEERFEDMASYIDSVIYGIKPLAVICGAPGVGKTYRIMQAIKKNGKVQGTDFGLIKGKCTAQNFYMMLHDYKEKGQLLVLDDADEIVKDDVAINLIKAACDSSDERWVSYGTSRPPYMPEEKAMMCDDAQKDEHDKWIYPKEFITNAGMIIITNMRAGQLDTAIKNRALLCDLDFTVDEVLQLVESIAPKIMADVLSDEAKARALDYLHELADKKVPMEISIRSFTLCAGLFMSDAPEKAIQRRIKEQMRLQFARGGKKY